MPFFGDQGTRLSGNVTSELVKLVEMDCDLRKNKGAANLRPLLLACTLPQVLRQTKLLQRSGCARAGAHSDTTTGYVANDGVFERAEGANAGLVRGNWIRSNRVAV